ncbi:KICSTOR complex protein szt2 [Mortierella sp. GBA30]|nr:KICSTOR complex protein szt2 [Mortierella sp. GBA30]
MASYYFQEDSSDESAGPMEDDDRPMPRSQQSDASRENSPTIEQTRNSTVAPSSSTKATASLSPSPLPSTNSSSSSSSDSSSVSLPKTRKGRDVSAKRPSSARSSGSSSAKSNASPDRAADAASLKERSDGAETPIDDAKSLAIAINDQELMSRSDLEESLLRNLFSPVKALESENVSVLYASTDKHLPWTEQAQPQPIESMRFVPQTRVFYISKHYRTVFMVDVSSSVLTVDSGGTRIVMGQVMDSLTKCLTGLSERFSCPGTTQPFVTAEVHVTVIAECSQFASNLHTGEMLANFPTMKTLLQDVVLTERNVHSVLKVLKVQLAKFQSRLSRFRGELRRTRETLGYALAVEDAMDDVTTELDLEDDISQRKSWGVGLSGANLSYTLTAGLFALGMMPASASPSLVVVTDGVVKSNLLHGSTILRRLMEMDVSCSVIQLGSRDGGVPSCNWGFIQDSEILRFVAEATLGKFMYSQDCAKIDHLSKAQSSTWGRVAPNMYHRAFLIRELCLLKPRPGLDDIDEREESSGYSLANFPWDPKSFPEPIKMMQTACKDYHLNIPVEMLVTARIRQGFRIKGVSIAPDRDRQASERYMITMTLAWLPNVTVQYKLKGQISSGSSSSNYFSRFESPKVEIDIVAYQAFAIHFLNSQHAPVNANHSVYAKVFRIHRYIIGLSDSDVTLRSLNNSHASANQALWTQKAKSKERSRKSSSSGTTALDRYREDLDAYLSRLSEQWSGLAKDADYQYSRGWYSEDEFDVLLLVPPPAFLPTPMDTKNSLLKYSEGLETIINGIRDYLRAEWASFSVGDVFVQTCQSPEAGPSTTSSSQFCELRIFTEPSVAILRVQLRFFGVSLTQRRSISRDLRERIYHFQAPTPEDGAVSKTESEVVQVQVHRCGRPIYRLLMRHVAHEAPLSRTPETTLTDFQTHVSEPIGEESVLRSYMVHKHWGWKDQVRDLGYLAENNYMASQDLAFQYICAQRLGEGFLLASAVPNRVVFYKEISVPQQEGSLLRGASAVQYLIFRSPVSGELVTQLWMEPSVDVSRHSLFDKTKADIIAVDRFILSRLATYEAIHAIGRLRLRPEVKPHPEHGFMYPWLFDPATLLRQQRLVTLAFGAPHSIAMEDQGGEAGSLGRCIHTLGLGATHTADVIHSTLTTNASRDLLLTRNANASTTSLSQSLMEAESALSNDNDIMAEYRDQLRELCCADRDLAILHLYMEKALSQLADGEIMAGGEDDACSQFFLDIKTSIKRNSEVRQSLMTFHCANSFQDIRCFVKSVNAKFFRLLIVPKLGSVISHLTKLRSLPPREAENHTAVARQDFLGLLMFECLRSKPLTDVSEFNANSFDQSLTLFELHPLPLGPAVSQQPLLLQPVVNEDQGKARVQESTLQLIRSISQAYSHSFAKAIYAALIEGHSVGQADLKKACQICTRTTVDINITGFLNTLEQGRRGGTISDEAMDLKTRFLDVLKHSFELAPVPGSEQTYFYRPLLRKSGQRLAKSKTRKRSPSVSRSGSIDADTEDALAEVVESAERPMFLHLECSFQKPMTQAVELERTNLKPSVTFPVTELPLSYTYKEKGSQDNYAPSSIGFDARPVDSADGTVAILHLVISTLPTPEEYSGPTLKSIDSESKIAVDSSQLAGPRSFQHLFPTLDSMQLEAIADTEARLEWLVKEEVMHGLLNMTPVTVDILSLVETQLKTKSNFVNFPTAMTLPLTFVKRKRGRDIFMQELGRTKMQPYELHQVGQYFYLTEGEELMEVHMPEVGTNDHQEESEVRTVAELPTEDLPSLSSSLAKDSSMSPSDDLCHGLGIVILQKPKQPKKSEADAKSASNESRSRRKRAFWLILVPKDSFIQMYFFSKSLSEEACNSILDHVRKAIDNLCVKVNQLTLLQSLNETRNCSKYLVPSDDTDPNADSESGSDSDQVSQDDEALVTGGSKPDDEGQAVRKFKPGEFACPLVYRVAWPLHWRVKPGLAMKSVAHLVLYPFGVQNRKNFFVVESQDDHDENRKVVVFLRLSEVDVQPEQEIAPADERGSHLSVSTKGDEQVSGATTAAHQPLDDAGSHANSPRPSPTASPGSRTAAPPLIRTETRELVIEVYGVEPPGKQVTVDLFSLLESRFYNSVVLSVVSTFLSRNATLKLTQADVDFILPVDRLDPTRKVLEIPQFINVPFAFLMYLKQNLCLFLNPLTGTDKVNALTRHYHTQFGRLSTSERHPDRTGNVHQLQVGDFSFFYNAVQGRTQTVMESLVGIGVAGVCLTVLGREQKPVFEVGYQEGDHDMEDIKKYFESFPNPSGLKPSKYSLMIEIWAQGSVNASALLDTICQSFRQSLCDDIIETSIAQGLCPSARDRRNDVDAVDGEPLIGERIQKNFIDPSFMVLEHAYQWKSPAVQSLTLKYSMPPWIMDSFLLELDEILTDVSVHFSPLLIRSMADSNRYKEYRASSATRKSFGDMTNIRFILIGGIQDLGDGSSSSNYGRRTSTGSDRTHSRRSSVAEGQSLHHSHKTSTHSSQQHPKRQLEDIKMYPNAITTSGQDEIMLSRNCFVVITANGFGLQAYTYNWGKTYHEFMFSAIEKVVKWHKDRMRFLDNILLQKMGLFHHVQPIPTLSASAPGTQPTTTSSQPPSASSSSLMQGLPRTAPQNSPHLGSNLRNTLSDSNGSTPNLAKTSTSPKSQATPTSFSDATNLANLIDDQFPSRARSLPAGTSLYGNDDSRSEAVKANASVLSLTARPSPPSSASVAQIQNQAQSSEQNSPSLSSVITTGLDVDQILRDYCLDPLETPREDDEIQDEVQRHGKPFLDMFTYHTKNAEDQQNAYNVYQKWSRRYRDRKGSPNALHENMNTSDLAIMLRSSRLLHFCRTPLLFTEFSSSLFPLADPSATTSSSNAAEASAAAATIEARAGEGAKNAPIVDPVVQWYSALAETFMREYSQYLATVGMQLLMYGNSKFDKPVEPSQSGELSFMSQFTVSQTLSVPSPAAFLFKSLQGGSIMCEVRLQGMFVCVTLYTLNRRYGRVKVAAPGFATAEANKQSLRVFTEQCARFKDRIHVNSFVYDFHLRYIHHILMESSKIVPPGSPNAGMGFTSAPVTSLPFSFDLLDVLHQFLQYHSRPAAYSRNRVYRGVYRTNVTPGESELPGHLFEYVIKNPQRYGFQPIQYQDRPKACFVSGRDLLSGYGGSSPASTSPGAKSEHPKLRSESAGQDLKGFGVGAGKGGLSLNSDMRLFGPHARHTSHDSNLNTKRMSRRMTASRSSYNVKEAAILEEEGVEYVLVISDGDQDPMGLTVHYYLLILRAEDVVKKLEDTHGPLVGPKDRLMAASHSLLHMRENSSRGGREERPNSSVGQLQPVEAPVGTEEGTPSEPKASLLNIDNASNTADSQYRYGAGERLMDVTELQERITERAVLADVVRAAEVRLDLMLKQAAQFFDRDSLWEMLLQGKIGNSGAVQLGARAGHTKSAAIAAVNSPAGTIASATDESDYLSHQHQHHQHGHHHHHQQGYPANARHDHVSAGGHPELGFADFLALGQRFHSTPLEDMEPDFRATIMAPGIDWSEVLTFLARYYSRWAREFMEHGETRSSGHVISSVKPGGGSGGTSLVPGIGAGSSSSTTAGRRGSIAPPPLPMPKAERARRHLVIFNPHNRDMLVHFVINVNAVAAASTTAQSHYGTHGNASPASLWRQSGGSTPSMKRTSAGDLSSKFNGHNAGTVGVTPRPHQHQQPQQPRSQSHSHLHSLLVASSQPTSPKAHNQHHAQFLLPHQQQQKRQQQQQRSRSNSQLFQSRPQTPTSPQHYLPPFPQHPVRPSFSEASSRVSSMTSIARAATLAVSKVASRLTSGRSRENSGAYSNISGASSRAPSVLMEDEVQSMTGRGSNRTSIATAPPAAAGSGGALGHEVGQMTRRTNGNGKDRQKTGAGRRQSIAGLEDDENEDRIRGRDGSIVSMESGDQGDLGDEDDSVDEGEFRNDDDENDNVMEEEAEEEDDEEETEEDEGDEDMGGAHVRVFSVSREPKSGYNAIESEHVGDIIRTLSYWIWRAQK